MTRGLESMRFPCDGKDNKGGWQLGRIKSVSEEIRETLFV